MEELTDIEINKDEWGTPNNLFRRLDKEFNFTIDVAADLNNKKCKRCFTKKENGLKQSWKGERVFCNPPYSGHQIRDWVMKAFKERNNAEVIVLLIPVRTDRKYFHKYILHHAEIRFLEGRPSFIPLRGQNDGAPSFPSMFVIYRKGMKRKRGDPSLYKFGRIKDMS